MIEIDAVRVVVAGEARGEVVALREPLSFWGGFDPVSGRVIDVHHPNHGAVLTGKVVVMRAGRGSSSAASVIAEAARLGSGPAALVVVMADEILSTGAIVADELYRRPVPIVEVDDAAFAHCCEAVEITLGPGGALLLQA